MAKPLEVPAWKGFETIGEDGVRRNIALDVYSEENLKKANEWLAHLVQVRSADAGRLRSEATSEQLRIARIANRIAITAAIAATVAAVAAIAGVIISIMVFLHQK